MTLWRRHGLQGNGVEPDQGDQPGRPSRDLRTGICLEPAGSSASGIETMPPERQDRCCRRLYSNPSQLPRSQPALEIAIQNEMHVFAIAFHVNLLEIDAFGGDPRC